MKQLKKFNGGQVYTRDFERSWFYVGAYNQKHVIELMKEATGYELNQSTIKNYWNKDCWGNTMKDVELTEPCVYVSDNYNKNLKRLL